MGPDLSVSSATSLFCCCHCIFYLQNGKRKVIWWMNNGIKVLLPLPSSLPFKQKHDWSNRGSSQRLQHDVQVSIQFPQLMTSHSDNLLSLDWKLAWWKEAKNMDGWLCTSVLSMFVRGSRQGILCGRCCLFFTPKNHLHPSSSSSSKKHLFYF